MPTTKEEQMMSVEAQEIIVTFDSKSGTVNVSEKEITVSFEWEKPFDPFDASEQVVWQAEGLEANHKLMVVWNERCPFRAVKAVNNGRVVARGNKWVAGYYEYSVLVVDEDGRVLGGEDPLIKNVPIP